MKRIAFALLLPAAAVALLGASLRAAPHSVAGRWSVETIDGAEFAGGVMVFSQVGQTIIGRAGQATINGTMVSDTKMDARWNGPRGAGWMTIVFAPQGDGFKGEWGYNGRKADGHFSGHRLAPDASAE